MNFLWPNKKPESSSPSADRKPVDRRELSPHELFAYANDLELQLEKAEAQRADLLRELESYTGASANLTWDATGLLQQRAIDAEAQLERLRTSFKHLSVSHDSLSDDFAKLKEAKRLSDQSGREATKKIWRIEDERSFYQKQAVEAMQARDRAEVEGSRLHERASALEGSLAQKDAELRAEQSAAEVLRQRLASLQEETDALRREAEVAAQVPQLRLDLRETKAALEREREAHSSASDAHQQSEQKRQEEAAAAAAAREACEAADQRCRALEADLSAGHELQKQLRQQLLEREAEAEAAAAAEARAAEAAEARAVAERRLGEAEEAQRDTAAALDKTRGELAAAAQELAAAQASVRDLTAKIAEVAEEKLRLLVENAELQERERESNTHERDDDDDAWGAWPWKRPNPVARHHSPGGQATAVRPQAAPAASPS